MHENRNHLHRGSESDSSSSELPTQSDTAEDEDQYYADGGVYTPPPQFTPLPQSPPQGLRKIYHPHLTGWFAHVNILPFILTDFSNFRNPMR